VRKTEKVREKGKVKKETLIKTEKEKGEIEVDR
jgi:hypothetical protein